MSERILKELVGIQLPPGFHLEEEEDFLFLFFEGKKIANFSSSGPNPDEIKAEAERYLKKTGGK